MRFFICQKIKIKQKFLLLFQPDFWFRIKHFILSKTVIEIIIVVGLLFWYGIQLTQKIDLTTADLGRHIQNGAVIVRAPWADKLGVLHTNFYSYTLPEQPFINHHWLSGVFFYFIDKLFGFTGLSVFYVLLGLITFWLFFKAARKSGGFWLAVFFALLLMPLMSSRAEVRPEIFTYLFSGIFYYVLMKWRKGKLKNQWLFILPATMLFWVNLHIGFAFGFLILGAFGLEQIVKYFRHKPNNLIRMLSVAGISGIAALLNPFGYKALLYPLTIFKNYGYLIVENQSVKFLENLGFKGEHFLLFKAVIILSAALIILLAVKNRRKINFPNIILTVVGAIMAYLGIRHFPSFAFFALPFFSEIASNLLPFGKIKQFIKIHLAYKFAFYLICSAFFFAILAPQRQTVSALGFKSGIGLLPNNSASADFFVKNRLKGPIFNDYDIGGYLIYNLYPAEKVFVDNRPEAYSVNFFENIYKAAQQDNDKWEDLDRKYKFNIIFFSHRDYTPWAQQFLISRVNDSNWAPIFADNYNIIFIRKSKENIKIIQKYYIPKERFGIVRQ